MLPRKELLMIFPLIQKVGNIQREALILSFA
ncbi:hypothetical protein O23A_P3p0023 (plasmid) [Aeromonas salmonicida]|nr:hypothetical protein O23A_P3p0023 [Aeromonas salmonicida]